MKLKVVSDGTAEGTTVTDAETGEEVDGVQGISIDIDLLGGVRGTVRTIAPHVTVKGEFSIGRYPELVVQRISPRHFVVLDSPEGEICAKALRALYPDATIEGAAPFKPTVP